MTIRRQYHANAVGGRFLQPLPGWFAGRFLRCRCLWVARAELISIETKASVGVDHQGTADGSLTSRLERGFDLTFDLETVKTGVRCLGTV